jgi:histidinol-phosphate phosphatase family protein
MIAVKQAVILAGGRGTRLRPLTDTVPKPMIVMNGRPFLEYLIELLRENGICEIVLLLGYLPEKITEHFGDGSRFGVRIRYSISDVTDDTGTRIKKAEALLDDHFLLMYCDNYFPLNLKNLVEFYNKQHTLASVLVYTNKDKITKNNVRVDDKGQVVIYDRSRQEKNLNGVELGFFILDKQILQWMPNEDFSFQNVIVPKLIERHQLSGYFVDHRYYSIGSLERLPLTETFLQPKKVVFLDRDGVINKKPPKADYVKNWGEFIFLPGAIEALALLTKYGYQIYLISNQAGIARGAMTLHDLEDIHTRLKQELQQHRARIDGIYFCPHGWDDNCDCRKPKPGMLLQAARDHHLDLTKTVFIGDDERDIEAGQAAGCKTILVTPENSLLAIVRSLVSTDNYGDVFNALYDRYRASHKTRFLVSIGGCSRCGKSTLAHRIKEDLERKDISCTLISLDNWLLGIDERTGNETVRERFQYQKIGEEVARLLEGTTIYPPLYDPKTRRVQKIKSNEGLQIKEHGVGIVDGVVALDIQAVRDLSDFNVFVDVSDGIRKQRVQEFYLTDKGCSPTETEQIMASRETDEVAVIKQTKKYADIIYRGET